jgi:hypothetical protein
VTDLVSFCHARSTLGSAPRRSSSSTMPRWSEAVRMTRVINNGPLRASHVNLESDGTCECGTRCVDLCILAHACCGASSEGAVESGKWRVEGGTPPFHLFVSHRKEVTNSVHTPCTARLSHPRQPASGTIQTHHQPIEVTCRLTGGSLDLLVTAKMEVGLQLKERAKMSRLH